MLSWLAFIASLPLVALAVPYYQSQMPLLPRPSRLDTAWNPLEHMSGIAPYHDAPGADIHEPPGCKIAASAYLVRHGAIVGNDDEYEEYMQPFPERLQRFQRSGASFAGTGPLKFLEK